MSDFLPKPIATFDSVDDLIKIISDVKSQEIFVEIHTHTGFFRFTNEAATFVKNSLYIDTQKQFI